MSRAAHPIPDGLRLLPFRGSVAIAAGLVSRRQLQGSRWRRLYRDVYVGREVPDSIEVRAAAAGLLLPDGAAVTGVAAARLLGIDLHAPRSPIDVVTSSPFGPIIGMRIKRGQLPEADIVHGPVTVTAPLRTCWELGWRLPMDQAVMWGDAIARRYRIDRPSLADYAVAHAHWPGGRDAAPVLRFLDGRAESPKESLLRVLLHHAGLPTPELQFPIWDGYRNRRLDFAWPGPKVACEYDGRDHLSQLAPDRTRWRRLMMRGWRIYPVTASDLDDFKPLAEELRSLLDG